MNRPSLHQLLAVGLLAVVLLASSRFSQNDNGPTIEPISTPGTFGNLDQFCAHDFLREQQLAQDPMFQDKHDVFEKAMRKHILKLQNSAPAMHMPVLYTLPVVVHIVHDNGAENITDAQVEQGIQDLNDAFANAGYYDQGTGLDIEVQFCLAQRTPSGNATTGITRDQNTLTEMVMETEDIALKDLNRWEPNDYINIWLVRSINSLASGPGVAGYAYFPTSHGTAEDGIVMEASYFGSSEAGSAVTVHEMGHYLGLYHTFQGGCGNGDCTQDGDRVCDTPPDQSTAWVPCTSTPNTCSTDVQSGFPTDENDMIWNYMDYSDLDCYSAFTQGQKDRMLFSVTSVRASLLDSKGCVDPCASDITANFSANMMSVDAGGTVNFTNLSTNATSYDWRVDGTSFSTNTNASYTFNSPGFYVVTLWGFNADPNCEDQFSMEIEVTCGVDAAFSISNLFPSAGQSSNFTNLSINATNNNWLVNGVSQATSVDFGYTFTDPGTYTICLEASNAFCDDVSCVTIVVVDGTGGCPPPCVEVCDNGLDDDNDGYVDCYDDDCPCNTDECTVTDLSQNFATQLAWESPENLASVGGSPHVANMNPWVDSIPEILIAHASTNIFNTPCQEVLIYKGDGSNAANPARVNIVGGFDGYPDPGATVGDVNGDGVPELIMVNSSAQVQVYTDFDENAVGSAMDLWITATDLADDKNRRAYLADFNSDGISEIYVGDDIFEFDFTTNPPSLSKVLSGGSHLGQLYYISYSQGGCSPVATDLLDPSHCAGDPDCNGIELAAGRIIYSVDMTTADGDGYEIKIQRDLNNMSNLGNYRDGYTVTADIDLDGVMDLVVSSARNSTPGIYAWNRNGLIDFFPHPSGSGAAGSMPCVANVYNDQANGAMVDFPEIIVCCVDRVNAYNVNASNMGMANKSWWNLVTDDQSGITGTTVFDFNGDGIEEIVYRDEDNLRILYGGAMPFPPGVDFQRNWDTFLAGSGTMDEHPIVADVDNDKQAEIVVTSYLFQGLNSPAGDYRGRVRIFEADLNTGDPWMSARPTWNQFNYFSVNVNDDMSIPPVQQLHHLEFPQVGSGQRPLNKFLAQASLLNNDGQVYLPVPDATISIGDVTCGPDSVSVVVSVCNDGDALLPQITPIAFYKADPTVTAAPLHFVTPFGENVPADVCITKTIKIPNATGNIFVVVNDDGSNAPPYNFGTDFPVTNVVECVYINNAAEFSFSLTPPNPPDLGPDISFCNNGTADLDAGPGWDSYTWQDGFPEQVYTAWEAGTYWVDVTDACGNVYSDTIVITMDTSLQFDLGPDTLLCSGDSLELSVPGFTDYEWLPDYEIDCTNCPNVKLTPQVETVYTLVATDVNGCVSVDSVRVLVDVSPQVSETIDICLGDSILLFGNYETQAGVYTGMLTNLNGCDTISTVTLNVLPLVEASQTIQVCEGDSALIFGNWETQAGVYFDTLSASVGCDTAMAITLDVLPLNMATQNIDICQGDSILIFGNWENTSGTFVDTLPSMTDCDTIMTINLTVLPLPSASTTIQICDGDSILLFGNWENDDGLYTGILPSMTDCDTILTVILEVEPPISLSLDGTPSCEDHPTGTVSSNVTNGVEPFDYQWSINETTPNLSEVASGIYSLTLTDDLGCTAIADIEIGELAAISATEESQAVSCFGYSDGILTITEFEPGSLFSLDGQFFSQDTQFINLPSETYTLFVQSSEGCISEQEVNIGQPAELVVTLPADLTIEMGDSVVLNSIVNSFDDLLYAWTPGESLNCVDCPDPVASPLQTTDYTLQVVDMNGCDGEGSVQVFVVRRINVFAPNAFSPNGDGINDVFTIFSGTGVSQVKRLLIFDRWGENVFENYNFPANDPSQGWDGMFKSELMNSAVFVWFAEVEFVDGSIELLQGDLMLMR